VQYADAGLGVSAGCGIQSATRQLDCWGTNTYGELGLSSPLGGQQLSPANAGAGTGIAAVSSSTSGFAVGGATCFVTLGGSLRCMGFDLGGLLGTGRSLAGGTLLPHGVLGLGPGVATIAGGEQFTCARDASGGVSCWGLGRSYALGVGDSLDRPLPASVNVGPGGASALGSGDSHACAVRAADSLATCWGNSFNGQTGDTAGAINLLPRLVPGAPKARALAVGAETSCVLAAADSTAWCWGNTPTPVVPGQLEVPRAIAGTRGSRAFSVGYDVFCRIPASGNGLECAGDNTYGQLGDGTTASRGTFAPVASLTGPIASVATGRNVTCIATASNNTQDGANRLYCWGAGDYRGALGAGDAYVSDTASANPLPIRIGASIPWVQVYANADGGLCARSTGGDLWCWGLEPGDGSRRATVPVPVKLP
jgi:alpha-tubulin suppressor-like RCC1 family protein